MQVQSLGLFDETLAGWSFAPISGNLMLWHRRMNLVRSFVKTLFEKIWEMPLDDCISYCVFSLSFILSSA